MDAPHTTAGLGLLATAAPALAGTESLVDFVSKAGPSVLLAFAVVWLHRELQAERERCSAEYRRLHGDIADVRKEGEERHEACREELHEVHEKLLRMIQE